MANFFTTTELADLATFYATTLQDPTQCVIKRLAGAGTGGVTVDARKGFTATWASATTVATVACRLEPARVTRASERDMASKTTQQASWEVRVAPATDVRPRDRLVIGSRTFAVVGVLLGVFGLELVIDCLEIQ